MEGHRPITMDSLDSQETGGLRLPLHGEGWRGPCVPCTSGSVWTLAGLWDTLLIYKNPLKARPEAKDETGPCLRNKYFPLSPCTAETQKGSACAGSECA